MLLMGALVPHPPLIVPEVGGDSVQGVRATDQALRSLFQQIDALQPETVVIFSPHGPVFQDGIGIRGSETLHGDLRRFGARQKWCWKNDRDLAEMISHHAMANGITCMMLDDDELERYGMESCLDHGVLVPLSFLSSKISLVATGMGFLPREDLYKFGQAVGKAIDASGRRTVVIASGDLSHCLTEDAPAPYAAEGGLLDKAIVSLIKEADWDGLFHLDSSLVEKGAECGFRTLLMLLGVMDERRITSELLSYEGPFGVGYAVARFFADGTVSSSLQRWQTERRQAMLQRRESESPFVRLARLTIESNVLGTPMPRINLPPSDVASAGVFVSIKKLGELRGCIGTIEPVHSSIEEEIAANAIAAAFHDPRFDPIEKEELEELVFSVDLLMPPEAVDGIDELEPKKYGVIVKHAGRSGLLLPDLDGVDTPEQQVDIARRKAGIPVHAELELFRFRVERFY